ncbi:hypothetical protein SAMN05216413_1850 [Ruminococcaceae bacterium KH2T8]|nr:hypothetical protein SAMN05216413_1850 [Ruminococcaceae bacterium KH2T8]
MERKERTAVKLLILIPLIANILRVIGLLGSISLDVVIPVFITSHSKIFDTCGLVILIAESIAVIIGTVMATKRRMKAFVFLGIVLAILLVIVTLFFLRMYLNTYYTLFQTVY